MPRFYLTTAIDYVNSPPHLGTAYEKITADVIARFKRSAGYDTHFLMGADEHSLNVRRKAEEQGLDPLDYCARMEDTFRAVWAKLDVSYDEFIRTTEKRHHLGVQKLLEAIRARGGIYEGTYEGWYCVSCEAFKQEKDLEDGSCPSTGRSRTGSPRRTTSSASRRTATGCSSSTGTSRASSSPRPGGTS